MATSIPSISVRDGMRETSSTVDLLHKHMAVRLRDPTRSGIRVRIFVGIHLVHGMGCTLKVLVAVVSRTMWLLNRMELLEPECHQWQSLSWDLSRYNGSLVQAMHKRNDCLARMPKKS